jgi:hypothetical protein
MKRINVGGEGDKDTYNSSIMFVLISKGAKKEP